MSATLEQIEAQALALPPMERSQLVEKLWQSLRDAAYPVLSGEWLAEVERRRQALLEGKAQCVPGEEVSRRAWDAVKSTRS
jgi:putative addiction module component (TIGR02574 family)